MQILRLLQNYSKNNIHFRKCRSVFIGETIKKMRQLPDSSKSEGLALYEGKENEDALAYHINDAVNTIYTDNAYLLTSMDEDEFM